MKEVEFDQSMNTDKDLQVVVMSDPVKLQKFIQSLPGYTEVVTIYGMNGKHFCWIKTNVLLQRKQTKK